MKRRIKLGNLLVMLIYFMTGLAIVVVNLSISEYKLYQKISNNYYSDKAIFFRTENFKHNSLYEGLFFGNVIFNELDSHTYSIYFNSKSFTIPTIQGRFFTPSDFENNTKKAVIGKKITDILNINGKSYYEFHGDYYEVIGTIGVNKPSKLDHSIYLSAYKYNSMPVYGICVIDGNNTNANLEKIESMNSKNQFKIERLSYEEAGVNRIFRSKGNNLQSVFKLVGFVFIITIISFSNYWILSRKNEITILKLCGISNLKITFTIFINYFISSIIGFFIGIFSALVFIQPMFSVIFKFWESSLFYIFIGIVICILPIIFMNKRWPELMLREVQV